MASARTRLLVVMGTRPEAIKLAPIVLQARADAARFHTTVVTTGQHREMLHQILAWFRVEVDEDLQLMRDDQEPGELLGSAAGRLGAVLAAATPDLVMVQGDTTTTLAGALCAFHHKVAVAHVEAGLRTHDKYRPFPEEINRRLTTQLADLHFAPTERARSHLLREGVPGDRIWVTGNSGIDALMLTLRRLPAAEVAATPDRREVLVTAHRRENHGGPLRRICAAILELADERRELTFTYPVHPSPRVREPVFELLGGHPRISLLEPLAYEDFVDAMRRAYLVLTDSGGVQEEAPALGKPVLVLRESTERPEGVEAGTLRLVGTDRECIVRETRRLLDDPRAHRAMAAARNPYGDGTAARQILAVLSREVSG